MADNGLNPWALAGKPTVELKDPNTVLRDAASTANAVMQNKLAQAGQARGELMQQAIDPQTGRYDPAKFNALAASDPRVAMALPEAINQSQSLTTQQADLGMKQNDYINKVVPSLLKLPDDQIHTALADTVIGAQQMGIVDARTGARLLAGFPSDPAQARLRLQQMQIATMPAGGQRDATFGTVGQVSNGQDLLNGTVAPVDSATPGAFRPAGSTPVYPSRDTLLNQQTRVGPDNKPVTETLAERARQQGRSDLTGPAGRTPGAVPDALLPPGYTGRYRPGAAPAASGQKPDAAAPELSPAPPQPVPAPGGGVVTGLAPGAQQEAEASVAHLAAARDAAGGYQNRMQPLLSAQTALASAKTGEGTAILNTVRQRLATYTPGFIEGFRPLGGSTETDAAFDEARKYLTNYAANTPGANRSDAGASTAAHANASVEISPEAAKHVVKAAIGMERMKQAHLLDFDASKQDGSAYDRHQVQLASKADPRAFMADQQSPGERKAMLDKMSPTQRQTYYNSVQLAVDHGLMTVPGFSPRTVQPQVSNARRY